jgi:long-chain acyl-CoA synthetase
MKLFKKKFFEAKNRWAKYFTKEELNIEVPNVSLYEYLRETASKYKEMPALNYFNKEIKYKELVKEIDRCARGLKAYGIRPGDVVAVCMPNTPEAIIAFYAINKIGAIANMIHPLSAEEEIKQSLNATKSMILITINITYKKIKNIINDTSVYKVVIASASDSMPMLYKIGYAIKERGKIELPKKNEFYINWNDLLIRGKKYTGKTLVKTSKDMDAVILHSGGTTGTPKNIVLTNGNINTMVPQLHNVLPRLGTCDSILSILPLFHCFGLVICTHVPLCMGVKEILIPLFDAKRFDKLITKYKPTILAGVPTLYEALLTNKHMENVDLSNVSLILNGGDKMSTEKNEAVNNFFRRHGCREVITHGYGLTETSGPVIFSSRTSDKVGTLGIPLPGNDLKIVDINTREECKDGEVGEICIAGPTVMKGYLNNIKETNETLEQDKNGKIWVHTGDLGRLDSDGVLTYESRLKRMLIVSGYNVYPSHIEEILLRHPAVETVGVVGIPHPYKVQVPKAYIVLKEGYKETWSLKKEIREYCEKNLAHYMIPKEFEYRESLPKTMLGKVNYRELESK